MEKTWRSMEETGAFMATDTVGLSCLIPGQAILADHAFSREEL